MINKFIEVKGKDSKANLAATLAVKAIEAVSGQILTKKGYNSNIFVLSTDKNDSSLYFDYEEFSRGGLFQKIVLKNLGRAITSQELDARKLQKAFDELVAAESENVIKKIEDAMTPQKTVTSPLSQQVSDPPPKTFNSWTKK